MAINQHIVTATGLIVLMFALAATNGEGRRLSKETPPLIEAILRSDFGLVRELIKQGADVNATDDVGNTPLYFAIVDTDEKYKILVYLVEHGADVNKRCRNELTPLHEASVERNLRMVRYLVEHGADLSAKADTGETPLFFAVFSENAWNPECAEIVQYLLSKGASAKAENNAGETALDWAKKPINPPPGGADGKAANQRIIQLLTAAIKAPATTRPRKVQKATKR